MPPLPCSSLHLFTPPCLPPLLSPSRTCCSLRPGCEGSRVKLDVSDIPEFSLFPGQVGLSHLLNRVSLCAGTSLPSQENASLGHGNIGRCLSEHHLDLHATAQPSAYFPVMPTAADCSGIAQPFVYFAVVSICCRLFSSKEKTQVGATSRHLACALWCPRPSLPPTPLQRPSRLRRGPGRCTQAPTSGSRRRLSP